VVAAVAVVAAAVIVALTVVIMVEVVVTVVVPVAFHYLFLVTLSDLYDLICNTK
jgi:hypothetical protein